MPSTSPAGRDDAKNLAELTAIRDRIVELLGAAPGDPAAELRALVDALLSGAREAARRSAELERASAELARSNRELEAFNYSVAHDLRAPFRHIVGYAEMLKDRDGARLSADGRRYLDTIIESASYGGALAASLLTFSQVGRSDLHLVELDSGALVNEIISQYRGDSPLAAGRDIEWRVGELPRVTGDAGMLRLALQNLVENAVKYTRRRPRAVIEIGAEPGDGETTFFVKDNGVGFDMGQADKLFGVFQRLHNVEEFEGSGVGLANVRRIIARHGGRAWAVGEVDRGATFFFTLPRRTAPGRAGPDRP